MISKRAFRKPTRQVYRCFNETPDALRNEVAADLDECDKYLLISIPAFFISFLNHLAIISFDTSEKGFKWLMKSLLCVLLCFVFSMSCCCMFCLRVVPFRGGVCYCLLTIPSSVDTTHPGTGAWGYGLWPLVLVCR